MQGLSIANNLLANQVQYNLNKNQESLRNTVAQLSSGLRINSAADDPSGLAISTNLQTQVDAFQQASQNVQDANNAAQVADGALATETDILQRIRGLAVEASSSINSSSDNANLQSEITQLVLEVNRISQNTNFNGQPLLDGSHAGFQPYTDASYTISSNTVLANAATAGATPAFQNATFTNPPEAANTSTNVGSVPGWTLAGTFWLINGNDGVDTPPPPGMQALGSSSANGTASQTITGLTVGATYSVTYQETGGNAASYLQVKANGADITGANNYSVPGTYTTFTTQTFTATSSSVTLSFTNVQAGSNTQFTNVSLNQVSAPAATSSSGDLVSGVTQITTTTAGFITSSNAGAGGAGTIFDTTSSGSVDGTIELQVVNTSSTTVAVQVSFFSSASGASGTQVIYDAQAAANSLVSVDGLNITIGNVTAADAGTTAFIKVNQAVAASSSASGPLTIQSGADEGNTVQIGIQATNAQTLRISNINVANTNAPVLAAEDVIGQVQNALDALLSQRAQLGAVIVRLNEDANNDNVAAVNLQASESAIRDLNVGQATTEFTKLQVLVQVGTSVLAQSNSNAQSVLGLFH
ncbi:MAG TPA: flagellin [Candidatus Baltobacteraceae bacterium]|nr:flagellin [Candidatus Baltobacteraceae bacterium]